MNSSFPRPSWLRKPLLMVTNLEPLSFRRRKGEARANEAELYEIEHSEPMIRKFAELGVNCYLTHFHKGFGLESEREEIENYTRKVVKLCKKYNIKVCGYIRSDNIFQETFLQSRPEASKWARIDQHGRNPGYHYYRNYVCFNHPEYEDYLREVIKYGLLEVGLDAIHFDGHTPGGVDDKCHCPLCLEKFRAYLLKKYPDPKLARERFGIDRPDWLMLPEISAHRPVGTLDSSKIMDPVMQEWTQYQSENFVSFHRRIAEYVRKLKPETGIFVNSKIPVYINTSLYQGTTHKLLAPYIDGIWEETGMMPEFRSNGVIGSYVSHFKMCRQLGNMFLHFTFRNKSAIQYRLCLAQALALNYPDMGLLLYCHQNFGEILNDVENRFYQNELREFLDFMERNKPYLDNQESQASVAILHSYPTLAFDCMNPYYSLTMIQQSLLKAKIPFNFVYDENLSDLKKYKVLLVANQSMLTAESVRNIMKFVADGGSLLASEETGQRDEFGRQLPINALSEVFSLAGKTQNDGEKKGTFGKGRWCYLPTLEKDFPLPPQGPAHGMPYDRGVRMDIAAAPKNHKQIIDCMNWLSCDSWPVHVKGPEGIVCEIYAQHKQNRLIVHLLNYDLKKPASNLSVEIPLPAGRTVARINRLEMGLEKPIPVTFQIRDKSIRFRLSKMEVYALISVEFK